MRFKFFSLSLLFFIINGNNTNSEENSIMRDCLPLQSTGLLAENSSDNCDTYGQRQTYYSQSVSEEYLASFSNVKINVSYWAINETDGQSENPFTEEEAEESIQLLNESFESMSISFQLKKFDTINNSTYYWNSLSKFYGLVRAYPSKQDSMAINVYVPYKFTNFENGLRGAQVNSRSIAVNSDEYNTGILVHEIGHVFDLKHIHRAFKSKTCERVTRDPENENYNANCAGDFITDTGAMPSLNNNNRLISQDCNYMGSRKDCDETPYELGDSEIKNFMAYTLQHCRDRFTIGQGIRVREYIKEDPKKVVATFIAK